MTGMDYDPEERLSRERVAIVGVGGTGSHVLDYVSKTRVADILLFDGDTFSEENKRRSPGVFGSADLGKSKGTLHEHRYARVHPAVRGFPRHLDERNVNDLADCTTVFLCKDGGRFKGPILEVCEAHDVVLINVGMGVLEQAAAGRLAGMLTVTACLPGAYDHAAECFRTDGTMDPEHNLQTIELNALNAALAVIKWKKILGIFADDSDSLDCLYDITTNELENRVAQRS